MIDSAAAEREKPLPDLSSDEGPFEWSLRLLPQERRLWKLPQLRDRWARLAQNPGVETWAPSRKVAEAAGPVVADDPPYFFWGDGPIRMLLLASPHADEPVGVSSVLALLEGLLREENRPLAKLLRVAVAPAANRRGYIANEAWFDAANALEAREPGREFKMRMMAAEKIRALEKPRPGNLELADAIEHYIIQHLQHRRRTPPEADVEFGYAEPGSDPADPSADFLPECRRHAAFMDEACRRWGGLDLICPLHSMTAAGGAFALLRATDHDNPGPEATVFMQPFRYAAAICGLGLHDQNRQGEKGFWRLAPGFHTTPTAEEMRAYFAGRGASVAIRYNSMQWAGKRARRAAVPEIPLFLCRQLRDESPSGETQAQVARRAAQVARDAARHLAQAEKIEKRPKNAQAVEEALARRVYLEQTARAREEDAAAPGTETALAARRDAAGADVWAVSWPTMAESMLAAAEGRDSDDRVFRLAAQAALRDMDWRPVSLKHQILMQLTLVLAGVRDLAPES